VIRRDEDAVADQHQLAVGVAGRGHGLPTGEDVARVEEVGVRPVANEGAIGRALLDQLVRHVGRDPVTAEPLDEDASPVLPAPDERALRIVDPALRDGRARQLGEVRRCADMVGVEMRDHDAPNRLAVERGELVRPPLPRVRQAEPCVDHRPTVLAGQQVRVDVARPVRERERDAADSALELVHPPNPIRLRCLRPDVAESAVLTEIGV
jgi:hypothetical protein